MAWVGRDLKDHVVPNSLGRDMFHWTSLLKAPSNLALNTSRDGASGHPQPFQGKKYLNEEHSDHL